MKLSIIGLAVATMFGTVQAQTQALNYEAKEISTVLKAGGVDYAWSRGFTGKGSIIAVLDQGFDLTNADFASKVIASRNFNSAVAYKNPTNPNGVTWGMHGTLIAGVAAGARNGSGTIGVAPDAQLLLGQVGQGGTSPSIEMAAVVKGIDWASANGATVINLSLGSTFDATFRAGMTQNTDRTWKAPALYGSLYGTSYSNVTGFAVGTNRGSIIVAAAGNQGLPYAQMPAAYATQVDANGKLIMGGRMLIVGATDATGKIMAPFSNRAGSICSTYTGTTCADPYLVKDFYVVAPGMQVYGTAANQLGLKDATGTLNSSGSIAFQGTSPATAYVSGGIALMKQAWPQLRPEQLVSIVLNTAKDLGAVGVDDVYGHGLVDFDAATRPMGTLVLANNTKLNGSGPQGKTMQLQGTGIMTGGAVSLSTSSILQNTQVVDTIGRNYAVDLTKAVNHNNAMSYQFGSPWMSLAGNNYRNVVSPIGKDATLSLMVSDNGAASQYEWKQDSNTRIMFEIGTLQEKNGFLGTMGGGATSFGGSNTMWSGFGVNRVIIGNTSLIGNYTMGVTRTSNTADSMVQLGSNVISDSWKVGVAQSNILFSGKTKDTLSFAVASPVAVRSGHATVTGVTGYDYSDNSDGTTTASPITQSERVSLAPQVREMNLVLGYTIVTGNTASVGVNVVRQFNVAGQAGLQGTGVSIMARQLF